MPELQVHSCNTWLPPVRYCTVWETPTQLNNLFLDQLPHGAKSKAQTPMTQPPPTLPDSGTTISDTPSRDNHPPAHKGTSASTTRQVSQRPLPTKKTASVPTQNSKKRKHTTGPRSAHCFEETKQDTTSDEDDPGNFSGDGSSSGDSLSDDAPSHPKRQRTAGIVTRSSTRIPAPDASIEGGLNVTFLAPSLTTHHGACRRLFGRCRCVSRLSRSPAHSPHSHFL
jgi:hypothetical protein